MLTILFNLFHYFQIVLEGQVLLYLVLIDWCQGTVLVGGASSVAVANERSKLLAGMSWVLLFFKCGLLIGVDFGVGTRGFPETDRADSVSTLRVVGTVDDRTGVAIGFGVAGGVAVGFGVAGGVAVGFRVAAGVAVGFGVAAEAPDKSWNWFYKVTGYAPIQSYTHVHQTMQSKRLWPSHPV